MPTRPAPLRRVRAALAVAMYVASAVVAPAGHLLTHASGTPHAHVGPRTVDTRALRDRSGHVDLRALAGALQLGEQPHQHGAIVHAHAPAPRGDDRDERGPTHGAGSISHFALAFSDPGVVAPLPEAEFVLPAPVARAWIRVHAARAPFLSSQRSQAPPTNRVG